MAEQAMGPGSDDDIVRTLTAFNMGVAKVSRLVRRLLPTFRGYECKEPEPGKFTLAFRWTILYCVAVSAMSTQLRRDVFCVEYLHCAEQEQVRPSLSDQGR